VLASIFDVVIGLLEGSWEFLHPLAFSNHVLNVLQGVVVEFSALRFPVAHDVSKAVELSDLWDFLVKVEGEHFLNLSINGDSGLQLSGQFQMGLSRSFFHDHGSQVVEFSISARDN